MDLTKSQWKEKLSTDEDALIIDVRTQAEVNEGYIPNMMHLDIYDATLFMKRAREMDPSKSYFIYCRSGIRSRQACTILRAMGFEKTYNLMGGFIDWDGDKTV